MKIKKFLVKHATEFMVVSKLADIAKEEGLVSRKGDFVDALEKWIAKNEDWDGKKLPSTGACGRGANYTAFHKRVGNICDIRYRKKKPGKPIHNLYDNDDYSGGFFKLRPAVGRLRQQFTHVPSSVWDTRQRDWSQRRRLWLGKGIQSELGRDGKLTYSIPMALSDGSIGNRIRSKTSIFDPVICEIIYGWYCKPGGTIIDPFAGGSVRGIVASILDYKYWGVDLQLEQVEANRAQVNEATRGKFAPKWHCGDSLTEISKGPKADLVFSGPPYGNLEVYSDNTADISNMPYDKFLETLTAITAAACARLRDDRFAVYSMSNYRDRDEKGTTKGTTNKGSMRNLVGDTIKCFESAGLRFYNDIVLVNSVGTGAMRCKGGFVRGARKVFKSHQNILVFIKGDARRAAAHIPVDSGVDTGEGDINGQQEENGDANQEAQEGIEN